MKLFCKCVDEMKYLEKIPDFLSMYGVFTSQNTSPVRQEMSGTSDLGLKCSTRFFIVGIDRLCPTSLMSLS